jgi:hypothetical protein
VQIVEDLTINRPRFVARGKGSVSLIVVFITVGEVVMISLSGEDFLVRFVEEVGGDIFNWPRCEALILHYFGG